MSPGSAPLRRARFLVSGAVMLPLLTGVVGAPAATAAPEPVVRLAPDGGGSVVESAEVDLAHGTSRLETSAYSMVGATWRGRAPTVSVRTGAGEPWQELPVLEDLPTLDSGEGAGTPRATDLLWTGRSTDIDVRVTGSGHRDLELVLIDPGQLASDRVGARTAQPSRAPSARATTQSRRAKASATRAPRPQTLSRRAWRADPSWRNGSPRYVDTLQQVHVHHTATGNSYRRKDVPGILRGMYRYHTKTLGWFDIGYNFLVDRFGRAWVGRSGGAHRLVQGAHTLGFNHNSVGIAMIGNYESAQPRKRAVNMLIKLASWKFDRHGRRAAGRVWATSTGSDKYRDGQRVRLPRIDGHRDTNDTACPGRHLYKKLPGIRRRTQDRIERFS